MFCWEGTYTFTIMLGGLLGGNRYLSMLEIGVAPYYLVCLVMTVFTYGASIVMANSIGEGDTDRCNRIYTLLMVPLTLAAMIVALLGIVFARQITEIYGGGASKELLETCTTAIRLNLACIVPYFLAVAMENMLTIYGHSREAAYITITAMVGSVLFMTVGHALAPAGLKFYVFCFGASGSDIFRMIAFLILMKRRHVPLRIVPVPHRFREYRDLIKYGFADSADDILDELVLIAVNRMLIAYLGEASLGVFAAVNALVSLVWLPYCAGGRCSSPLYSALLGFRDRLGIRKVTNYALTFTMAVGLPVIVLFGLFAGDLVRLCGYTGGTGYEQAVLALRIYCIFMPFYGVLLYLGYYYSALKHFMYSLAVSVIPDSVIFPVMALILMNVTENRFLAFYLSFAGCYAVYLLGYLALGAVKERSVRKAWDSLFIADREIRDRELLAEALPLSPGEMDAARIAGMLTRGGLTEKEAQEPAALIFALLIDYAEQIAGERPAPVKSKRRNPPEKERVECKLFTDGNVRWIELFYGTREHSGIAEKIPTGLCSSVSWAYFYDFNAVRINLYHPIVR